MSTHDVLINVAYLLAGFCQKGILVGLELEAIATEVGRIHRECNGLALRDRLWRCPSVRSVPQQSHN
jgi:hypothetical protein